MVGEKEQIILFSSWRLASVWFLLGLLQIIHHDFLISSSWTVNAFVMPGPNLRRDTHDAVWSSRGSMEVENQQTWKEELLRLCAECKGGFDASRQDRQDIQRVIQKLVSVAKTNNNIETAIKDYYDGKEKSLLRGKWDLLYTNAPDILSLESSSPPFLPNNPLAPQLGRIGQDCTNPPIIENVIEWNPPSSVPSMMRSVFPDRVLQKVSCRGSYKEDKINLVNLSILGARLETPSSTNTSPPTPLITLPFGSFRILYIDSELRITQTNQNYYAVNRRSQDSWF